MAVGYLQQTLVMFLLLMMMMLLRPSVQLRSSHPMHETVDRINHRGGPYIGLVLAFPAEEAPLQASGLFVPDSDFPVVQLSGRRFNVGKIRNVDVIYVMTGEQTANAALTVQTLVQVFDIKGIVHYGIAGATNSSMTVGDVGVPDSFAFTSSWKWLEFGSLEKSQKEMRFGAFNIPQKGENLLFKINFTPVQLYSNERAMQELFWFPVDPHWYDIAKQLQGMQLERCVNESVCAPKMPGVSFGLKGSTANMFVANEAYANFLYKEFRVSTADEESAAVVLTSLSNGVPCIVFRGVSDVAGGDKISLAGLSSLAAINAFKVAVKFIELVSRNRTSI
ncbi:hypothetical protein RND81_14G138500 [Saponaria officinalis]|uniref:Nucleoside phosphorylase domain-containing protein n=1 Tax=Saponaria officinalis TaxID=3572 RepID=A0AAW1GQ06_SAPOF